MRARSFGPGVWAAVKADTLSLTAFEIGLFGWMALTYFVFFHPLRQAESADVLANDASRNAHRFRNLVPDELVANQERNQGSDVSRGARFIATVWSRS